MHRDFMQKSSFLRTFHACASIFIDEQDESCMLVCDLHTKGLQLKYIHAPIHSIKFESSVHADRLATVAFSLRVVESAKAKVLRASIGEDVWRLQWDDTCHVTFSAL